jgi:hypothetical protein
LVARAGDKAQIFVNTKSIWQNARGAGVRHQTPDPIDLGDGIEATDDDRP